MGMEEVSVTNSLQIIELENTDEQDLAVASSASTNEHVGDAVLTSELANSHELATCAPYQETVITTVIDSQKPTKRKLLLHRITDLEVAALVADDSECSTVKKPKLDSETSKAIQITDSDPSDGDVDKAKNVVERLEKGESSSSQSKQVKSSTLAEWKPIERELCLKGVEIFGKNR